MVQSEAQLAPMVGHHSESRATEISALRKFVPKVLHTECDSGRIDLSESIVSIPATRLQLPRPVVVYTSSLPAARAEISGQGLRPVVSTSTPASTSAVTALFAVGFVVSKRLVTLAIVTMGFVQEPCRGSCIPPERRRCLMARSIGPLDTTSSTSW